MTLAEIIATKIPSSTLERVVFDHGVLDEDQRTSIFKAVGLSPAEVAERVVQAYGARASDLAFRLYEQVADGDWQTASLLSPHFDPDGYYNWQASLGGRIPSLPMDALTEFFVAVKRHICLIVARKGDNGEISRGTGFLVGPDLILTCRHVLEPFAADDVIDQKTNRVDVYFDFVRGTRVENFNVVLPRARRVSLLEKKWLEASCNSIRPDGLEDDALTPDRRPLVAAALDFMLLRLGEPVGLQPVERGGGIRRGWVTLPDDTIPQSLQPNDWILVPQHPEGFPLRVGVGQFQNADLTGTRIRYSAGTSGGASGAPCFNQKFSLVGLHNAFVGPQLKPRANQAIRFDHIAHWVRQSINGASAGDPRAPRWSIARTNEDPQVILGREALLKWLRASASAQPGGLRDRVYVTIASVSGAGCSFSSDVLHAEIRDSKIPRAVYGRRGQQLPATAEDFLVSLLREFGIDIGAVEKMPPRPGPRPGDGRLPALDGEVDKLERWLSDELPGWLARVVEAHVSRTVDQREVARRALEVYRQGGGDPPPATVEQAAAADPIIIRPNPWDYGYIVIDDLRARDYQGAGARTELRGEVRSLIAALIQGKAETAMPSGLRRLRWMLLGDLPDFLTEATPTADGVSVERLDPAAVGPDDVLALWARLAATYLPIAKLDAVLSRTLSRHVVTMTDRLAPAVGARLAMMQAEANSYLASLFLEVEK